MKVNKFLNFCLLVIMGLLIVFLGYSLYTLYNYANVLFSFYIDVRYILLLLDQGLFVAVAFLLLLSCISYYRLVHKENEILNKLETGFYDDEYFLLVSDLEGLYKDDNSLRNTKLIKELVAYFDSYNMKEYDEYPTVFAKYIKLHVYKGSNIKYLLPIEVLSFIYITIMLWILFSGWMYLIPTFLVFIFIMLLNKGIKVAEEKSKQNLSDYLYETYGSFKYLGIIKTLDLFKDEKVVTPKGMHIKLKPNGRSYTPVSFADFKNFNKCSYENKIKLLKENYGINYSKDFKQDFGGFFIDIKDEDLVLMTKESLNGINAEGFIKTDSCVKLHPESVEYDKEVFGNIEEEQVSEVSTEDIDNEEIVNVENLGFEEDDVLEQEDDVVKHEDDVLEQEDDVLEQEDNTVKDEDSVTEQEDDVNPKEEQGTNDTVENTKEVQGTTDIVENPKEEQGIEEKDNGLNNAESVDKIDNEEVGVENNKELLSKKRKPTSPTLEERFEGYEGTLEVDEDSVITGEVGKEVYEYEEKGKEEVSPEEESEKEEK